VVVWLVAAGWAACAAGRFRKLIDAALGRRLARVVFALFGLHGLLYVIAFRGPASHHEYWQFFAAPFVAVAMASVIALAYTAIVRQRQRAATAVASLLVAVPMPGFMFARDEYHTAVSQAMPVRYIEPYVRLAGLVPAGSPAMISRDWPMSTERFGQHVNRWGVAQILYYADRPLITTRNLDEILANTAGCSAYVLEVEDDPDLQRLNDVLSARCRSIGVGNHHVIFLLREPRVVTGCKDERTAQADGMVARPSGVGVARRGWSGSCCWRLGMRLVGITATQPLADEGPRWRCCGCRVGSADAVSVGHDHPPLPFLVFKAWSIGLASEWAAVAAVVTGWPRSGC
jgi:hypothetical protein